MEHYVNEHHHRKIWLYSSSDNKKGDDRWRTTIIRNGKEINMPKNSKEEMIQYLYHFYKNEGNADPVFSVVANMSYKYKVDHNRCETATYDRAMNTLNATIGKYPMANMPISTITENVLNETLENIRKDIKMTKTSYGNVKSLINTAFDYAERFLNCRIRVDTVAFFAKERLTNNTFADPKIQEGPQVFNNDEIRALGRAALEHPENIRYLAVLFDILTGLRNGELVALRMSDIDPENCTLTVRQAEKRYKVDGHTVYKIGNPKTAESKKTIVIPPAAISLYNAICTYNDEHNYKEWLLQNEKGRLHTYHMDTAIRRLCKFAGIQERSMHKCRKTTASILFDSLDWSKLSVKEYMRHTSFSTTENAYLFCRAGKREKYQQAEQFDEFWNELSASDISSDPYAA